MNLQPMNEPRPGQRVQCVECHAMIDADKAILDMEGVPFKAYYHDECLPVNRFLHWKYMEQRESYYFWKYEEMGGKTVYQCTKEPKPPTNEAGYYSFGYLLKVKGLLEGPTFDSIMKEWSKS